MTGALSGNAGGIHYALLSQSTSVQLFSTPFNTRAPVIMDGQLYASSNESGNADVFTVGTGIPTTGEQTTTNFTGMSTDVPIPNEFILFDLDPDVADPDRLYVADERAI